MDRRIIDQYLADAETPLRAIDGLTKEELLSHPIPGTWSIQQIVVHLADSDLIGSDRMKRVIAEDRPRIIGYDETAFATCLHYDAQDPQIAATLFRLNRLQTATILRLLPDEAFARSGNHSERGDETLETMIVHYIEHVAGHMKHLAEKRRLLGKPLR